MLVQWCVLRCRVVAVLCVSVMWLLSYRVYFVMGCLHCVVAHCCSGFVRLCCICLLCCFLRLLTWVVLIGVMCCRVCDMVCSCGFAVCNMLACYRCANGVCVYSCPCLVFDVVYDV